MHFINNNHVIVSAYNRLHDNHIHVRQFVVPHTCLCRSIRCTRPSLHLAVVKFYKKKYKYTFASTQTRALYRLLSIFSTPLLCCRTLYGIHCGIVLHFSGQDVEQQIENENMCEILFFFSFLSIACINTTLYSTLLLWRQRWQQQRAARTRRRTRTFAQNCSRKYWIGCAAWILVSTSLGTNDTYKMVYHEESGHKIYA